MVGIMENYDRLHLAPIVIWIVRIVWQSINWVKQILYDLKWTGLQEDIETTEGQDSAKIKTLVEKAVHVDTKQAKV